MKRFATFLLVLAMILSLAIPAFAATHNSITVTNAQKDETYELYMMFSLKVDNEENPVAYTYTITDAWKPFFAGEGKDYITVNDAGAVTAVSDAAGLAKAACEWAEANTAITPAHTEVAKGTTVAFTNLENGYWLITSTLGTQAMIETTPDKNDVVVNEKNSTNTIDKQVEEDNTGTYGDHNDAQIGQLVNFKSTVTIVKNTRNVVVHDKMTDGLTYTPGSVAIAGLTEGVEYDLVVNPTDHDDTFDIIFDQDWIDGLDFGTDGYKVYVITYTATLNEKAVVKAENGTVSLQHHTNETYVSFGDKSESTHDQTHTHAHSFSVFKHANGSDTNLADAVFSLKKAGTVVKLVKMDEKNYRVANGEEAGAVDRFETVASGDIVIWGVDLDADYTLEEIEAPKGYNKLKEEVAVTVDSGNGTRISIENNSGTELPSTGGVGTTMFYIFGGILVLAAVVLLVTKKRMAVAE